MAGSPGFRALPVSACRRLRPRWTRVRSRLNERSLLPSPPLPTGRRPRCRGFRGLSRSVPPIGGFRPTEFLSTLRPGRLPAQTQDSVPAREWLALVPVGLPAHPSVRESPTGKRRLSPAHATSPTIPRFNREPEKGSVSGTIHGEGCHSPGGRTLTSLFSLLRPQAPASSLATAGRSTQCKPHLRSCCIAAIRQLTRRGPYASNWQGPNADSTDKKPTDWRAVQISARASSLERPRTPCG